MEPSSSNQVTVHETARPPQPWETVDSFALPPSPDDYPPDTKLTAVIDVGSGSARAVVMQLSTGGVQVLAQQRLALNLMSHVDQQGTLDAEGVASTLDAIEDFVHVCRGYGVSTIHAVGTEALRRSHNATEISLAARRRYGVDLRVISGYEEAGYCFIGAVQGLPVSRGLLADLGGGSMELVGFFDRSMETRHTLPLGSLRIANRFRLTDRPTGEDLERRLSARQAMPRSGQGPAPGEERHAGRVRGLDAPAFQAGPAAAALSCPDHTRLLHWRQWPVQVSGPAGLPQPEGALTHPGHEPGAHPLHRGRRGSGPGTSPPHGVPEHYDFGPWSSGGLGAAAGAAARRRTHLAHVRRRGAPQHAEGRDGPIRATFHSPRRTPRGPRRPYRPRRVGWQAPAANVLAGGVPPCSWTWEASWTSTTVSTGRPPSCHGRTCRASAIARRPRWRPCSCWRRRKGCRRSTERPAS